jgi:MerR family copper efflux transcriptional regulator
VTERGWLDFEVEFNVYPGAMESLRVAELAERAGIAPSTVRFYERAGLLSPAQRAPNGYRMFDESALDELAFITRAKSIGMSLDDIADLVAAWPTGECRSLQARMRDFLAGRISQIREQQAELAAFEQQLQTVLDRLASRDPGPERCGHGCGCETDLDLIADEPASGPVPWGSTLSPGDQATSGLAALRQHRR